MKINVAGTEKEVAEGLTIAELIVAEKVENPDYVTVVLNDEFVEKDNFETTKLSAGDKVEFLYFMGGGSRDAKHLCCPKSDRMIKGAYNDGIY